MKTASKMDVLGDNANRMVEVLKGIAHPVRLGVVVMLCERDRTVTEMTEALGVRQSMVSQHLAPLRLLGLVAVDRTGGFSKYSLQEPLLRNMVDCLMSCKGH